MGLGIWNNEKCMQCGACCYEFSMFLYDEPCEHLVIGNGRAYCDIHDQKRPDPRCESFFCDNLGDPFRVDVKKIADRCRMFAHELGTVPKDLVDQNV